MRIGSIITFEGKPLRVWARSELAQVHDVDDGSGFIGRLRIGADGGPAIVVAAACHPTLTMDYNPERLRAEYQQALGVLVLRCGRCNAPVLAVQVA